MEDTPNYGNPPPPDEPGSPLTEEQKEQLDEFNTALLTQMLNSAYLQICQILRPNPQVIARAALALSLHHVARGVVKKQVEDRQDGKEAFPDEKVVADFTVAIGRDLQRAITQMRQDYEEYLAKESAKAGATPTTPPFSNN